MDNTSNLAKALTVLGCPAEKAGEMALQLDKRAHQLAREKNQSYEEALQHLLGLMRQGWAAQGKQ
jgi:hypothetical protein